MKTSDLSRSNKRSIDFETIKSLCKYITNDVECDDHDNYSGMCTCDECPVWNDLFICDGEF